MTRDYTRLPIGMRILAQWAVAKADKAPMAVDAQGNLYRVKVNHPGDWMSFSDALAALEHFKSLHSTHVTNEGVTVEQTGLELGFILQAGDPFGIVDFDVKDDKTHPGQPDKWTTREQFDFFMRVVKYLDSYTELSRSGKGIHVIVKGKIGRGFKRDGVEVYSQERFMICTGNVLYDLPVGDRELMLNNMVSQMRPAESVVELEELEAEHDDWYILQIAFGADNQEKFTQLWYGNWREAGYESQSHADLALMSMFTFYSDSNQQCRRLFWESGLGKREKAHRPDYLNRALLEIRQRQARERSADISRLIQAAEAVQTLAQSNALDAMPVATQPALPPPPEVQLASLSPVSAQTERVNTDDLPWPPGTAGMLARYCYDQAAQPVKEVGIAFAIGLLAGICGKAWCIPQSGLNMYVLVVGRSGIGKEALHDALSSTVKACSKINPSFSKFVDQIDYKSGPALMQAFDVSKSFVNAHSEFGKKFRSMALDANTNGPFSSLQTQLVTLYSKSGPQSEVGGMGYSDKEKNLVVKGSVALSLVGDTTPEVFYSAMTGTMMSDGTLSRFTCIEAFGDRQDENENRISTPDQALVDILNAIAMQADLHIAKDYSKPVRWMQEAADTLRAFNKYATKMINSTDDEGRRQMWNRAGLKAKRLAALLAVADGWHDPVVTKEQIDWALLLIMRDINTMTRRLDSGDVGSDDTARELKIISIIKEYASGRVARGYNVNEELRAKGIVPRSYIQTRISRIGSFTNHRAGATRAMDETLSSMLANGYINEFKTKLGEINYHGRAFLIGKLP